MADYIFIANFSPFYFPMVATRTPLFALVGNPNTGKTTLFNALAGMNQRVGNGSDVGHDVQSHLNKE